MAFREIGVVEVREVLRGWLEGAGLRTVAERAGVDRKTASRYVEAAQAVGLSRDAGPSAQARVVDWCAHRAGMRIHGTTAARPAEVFAQVESRCLLTVPVAYDVPRFTRVKVHRDFHVEVARSLYSAPQHLLGQYLDARADSELVKLFHGGALVSTHPRQRPGGRSTHEADLPAERAGDAMRDLTRLIVTAAQHGQNIGIYAVRRLCRRLTLWWHSRC